MALSLAAIERIKLAATYCNALAVAVVTVGVFAPLIYLATTMDTIPPERRSLFYGVMGLCTLTTMSLHGLGQAFLSHLEINDLPEA